MRRPFKVSLDPAAAYPAVAEVRTAIDRRDWQACRAVLDDASPDGRQFLIQTGGEHEGRKRGARAAETESFLRDVLAADSQDSAAAAMLGFFMITVGWSIRGRATHVRRQDFVKFQEWLRGAEQVLHDAVGCNPDEPAIWVARLLTARGLELGLAESRRRYDRLRALDPRCYPGQEQFLQRLCPKWGGSWDLLHPWAREEMMAAPPGSLQGGLVALGHLEQWLALGRAAGFRYLRQRKVRDEIHEAAQRSIWHLDFRRGYPWVRVAATFAVAFSMTADHRAAARVFAMTGTLGDEFPWRYATGMGIGTYTAASAMRQRRAIASVLGARR